MPSGLTATGMATAGLRDDDGVGPVTITLGVLSGRKVAGGVCVIVGTEEWPIWVSGASFGGKYVGAGVCVLVGFALAM